MKETWKDIFCKQLDCGSFWKNLHKEDFDSKSFLMRSDAVYICKKAQADVYEDLIEKLSGKVDESVIEYIKQMLDEHWKSDDSALGMWDGENQIK